MRRIATYYCAFLALANCAAGYAFILFDEMMRQQFSRMLQGQPLPPLTGWFSRNPSWPYLFVALFILGTLIGLTTRTKNNALLHFIILVITAEAVILFGAMFAYAIPLVPIYSRFE